MLDQLSPWADPVRVAQLTKWWNAGDSALVIAMKLGCGITRNSVIGKVRRLKLPYRASTKTVRQLRKPKRCRSHPDIPVKSDAVAAQEQADAFARYQEILNAPEPVIPLNERQTLLIRKADGKLHANDAFDHRMCRWPIGDVKAPDFHFCGRPKVQGLSYCEHHARRASQAFSPSYLPKIPWVPREMKCPTDKTKGLDDWDEKGEKGDEARIRVVEEA